MSNSDPNSQTSAVVQSLQSANLEQSVVRTEGAGKAYQVVSQSTAIAVQDATDGLRNSSMVLNTALGVAMAQLLATGDQKYAEAALLATSLNAQAAQNFKLIGQNAAEVLNAFPSK